MRCREPRCLLVAVVLALGAGIPNAGAQSPANPAGATKNDWAYYGHDTGGTRYSPLAQINRDNVSKLKVASTDLEYTQQYGAPYGMFRTFLFAKAHHLPCAPPPWGTLTAVGMAQGTFRWQVPVGSIAPSKPIVPAGAPSLGGPIVTAGGLVFIAGTIIDPAIRAFDVETGKEIWKFQLPTSGAATPMTYQVRPGGKQYLVIAAGGHSKVTQEKQPDEIVAFTLP